MRPSRTWGALCCRAEWSTGPPLSGGMVLGKGIVRNSGADLQHAMGASWGPTHLLVGAHPTVQQPLHRALRGCRRDGGPVATEPKVRFSPKHRGDCCPEVDA